MNNHQVRLAAVVAASLGLLSPVSAGERQALKGHIPAVAARSQAVGRVPASERLRLVIGLPLRDQQALGDLLQQFYAPASPQFRHYLTPAQFAERFGPTQADYEKARVWAESQGLVVDATHPNRTLLDVSGPVENLERAFHLTLLVYQHPTEARTFRAPNVEPSLDLTVPILHVSGLDNLDRPRPLGHRAPRTPGQNHKPLGGSAPGGSFLGRDFRAAYAPSVELTGAGQSVALLEFDGYYTNDITDYEALAGITNVPLQNVLLDGVGSASTPGGGNFEVALDIEMAIAMAPGLSQVLVYEGNNDKDILNRIATDNAARQISSSWTLSFDATTDQIFKQYAAQGQSFFQASGDDGAYPNGWLADDPYLTAVGGTELHMSGEGGAWVSETVWNQGFVLIDGATDCSGGGISVSYSIPSWQKGLSMALNKGSTIRRNSPDVAMVAQDVWVLWNNGDASSCVGTSAAAPLWAGFAALANQLAQDHGQPPIGFINPTIYALGQGPAYTSLFHDITTGSNTNPASPTRFFAVPGYDLCTGWGTPKGSYLLQALALPQFLQITPATNFIATGPVGGAFSPALQNCALTNSGSASLDWAVASEAPWLDISPTSGSLAPGDPLLGVSVGPNAAANNLPAGTYTANLWFTNLSDGSIQTRRFSLSVFSVPVIVSSLVDQAVLEGASATFSVVVSPTSGPVSYQWIRDGVFLTDDGHISGSTTGTLTIDNVSAADVGHYEVIVMNPLGVVTSLAPLLTVDSPPVILTRPAAQTVLPGGTATFSVKAAGTQPLYYQWQAHGTNLAIGGNASVLTLRNVNPADAGAYSVTVRNILGSTTNAEAILALTPLTAPGVDLVTLHSFTGSDGANPLSTLVQGPDGRLYGTTSAGGGSGQGTVFSITTNGTFSTLHGFTGGNDGASPGAALVMAADRNLYGTTQGGGRYGLGVVFRITPTGAFTTLHSFSGTNDGGLIYAGLLQAADGNLYGTASYDSLFGSGTVFRLATNGTFTLLHQFNDTDGLSPRSGVIQARDGAFYGLTHAGGAHGDGTAFRITADGSLTTLYDFQSGQSNPVRPSTALLQAHDGNFYATCGIGGIAQHGAIYRLTPAGQLTTLYSFLGGRDGRYPLGGLLERKDGYFYGTTSYGGTGLDGSQSGGEGSVFRMTPQGEVTTIACFVGPNGANPGTRHAALIEAADGGLYGTTFNGGAHGDGAIFRLSVPTASLSIALSGRQLVLSWPAWASDLALQQAPGLASGNWSAVTNSPAVTNLQNQVVLPSMPGAATFFRLAH
jgi:uncharacterized repeat protein (TIGR03803 family)